MPNLTTVRRPAVAEVAMVAVAMEVVDATLPQLAVVVIAIRHPCG